MFDLGVDTVVVSDGKRGVFVADGEELFYHGSLNVDAVDSVGAGDAFGSAFAATLLSGGGLPRSIRNGILNSGSVVTHFGAKQGLLSREGLEHFASSISVDINELLFVHKL
jgi:sugar/nucleoside kinase (ribokinase family)